MELNVTTRTQSGKRNKGLRTQGLVPGVVYGKHMDKTVQIVFPKNDFLKLYKQAGTSTVVDLEGDYKGMVLIYDLQIDTITNNLLHVDFLAVRADEEVTADVSIVLSGESVLVKNNEGRIELLRDNISVTALPRDLPHEIVIDISNIVTLQDGIFMRDLDLGKKVKINEDADLPVVVAVELQKEDAEATVAAPTEPAPAAS